MVNVPIEQDTSALPTMIASTTTKAIPTTAATPIITTHTTTTINPESSIPPKFHESLELQIDDIHKILAGFIYHNESMDAKLSKHDTLLRSLESLNLPQIIKYHNTCLSKLEKFDIVQQVSNAVDEQVADVVQYAMEAPLRARFRDLPTLDMKEI